MGGNRALVGLVRREVVKLIKIYHPNLVNIFLLIGKDLWVFLSLLSDRSVFMPCDRWENREKKQNSLISKEKVNKEQGVLAPKSILAQKARISA